MIFLFPTTNMEVNIGHIKIPMALSEDIRQVPFKFIWSNKTLSGQSNSREKRWESPSPSFSKPSNQ